MTAEVAAELVAQDARSLAEQRVAVATQWQLIWWRFRKHKLALGSTFVLAAFYLLAIFADFFAYADPHASDAQRSLIAPQSIHWFDEGRFRPYVHGLKGTRDPTTFKRVYKLDTSSKIPLAFFVHGEPYRLFGFITADLHLLGLEGRSSDALVLLGTDVQGRDLWSRLVFASASSKFCARFRPFRSGWASLRRCRATGAWCRSISRSRSSSR
jgi:peptide/nickel transport system permease protein